MLTAETIRKLRELAEKATPGPWSTQDPHPGDDDWPRVMAIAATAGRQKIYAPAGSSYPHADRQYIAATSPDVVIALLDEIERLQTNRDHSCTCPHGDAKEPLVNHNKTCPIRVNKLKRIAPEVAINRLAAALHSGDENDELREQLAATESRLVDMEIQRNSALQSLAQADERLAAMTAENERLERRWKQHVGPIEADRECLREDLAAMTAARDEACVLARIVLGRLSSIEHPADWQVNHVKIDELLKVGSHLGGGQ